MSKNGIRKFSVGGRKVSIAIGEAGQQGQTFVYAGQGVILGIVLHYYSNRAPDICFWVETEGVYHYAGAMVINRTDAPSEYPEVAASLLFQVYLQNGNSDSFEKRMAAHLVGLGKGCERGLTPCSLSFLGAVKIPGKKK